MSGITFANPENLWFSLVIPILILIHFITLRYTKQKAFKFANYEAIERISGGVVLAKNITLLIMRVFAATCFILAASGIILNYTGEGTTMKFVLAIDASSSMTAADMAPSRLAAAKTAAKIFVDEVGARARAGVISFSGTSFIHEPITDNAAAVRSAIDSIRILAIGGTDIGEAIVTAANMFESDAVNSDAGKSLIILTDGRSNVGIAVDKAIDYANAANIAVFTIGVGTPEGGLLQGTNVTLKIDEATLQNIAEQTGGRYYKAESGDQLMQAYRDIAIVSETKVSLHLATAFLLIGLILLTIEWSLLNTKYRTLP